MSCQDCGLFKEEVVWSVPTFANLGVNGFGTVGSRFVGSSEWVRIMLDEVDDVDWPGGEQSSSREVRQVQRQRRSMSQLEFRDESVRLGRQPAVVTKRDECRGQYERGEQRAVSMMYSCAFVLIMLCTGGDQDRIADSPRGWSSKAWRLLFSGVFHGRTMQGWLC